MSGASIDIDRLAALAALRLTDADRTALADDLQRMAEAAAELEEVGLDDRDAEEDAPEAARPDVAAASLPRAVVEGLAPQTEDGYLVVPLVIED
jgi:aspartyl-tRNA(Asn)/glutamyl-tRNA(Gln) amidotransferase subunit C